MGRNRRSEKRIDAQTTRRRKEKDGQHGNKKEEKGQRSMERQSYHHPQGRKGKCVIRKEGK